MYMTARRKAAIAITSVLILGAAGCTAWTLLAPRDAQPEAGQSEQAVIATEEDVNEMQEEEAKVENEEPATNSAYNASRYPEMKSMKGYDLVEKYSNDRVAEEVGTALYAYWATNISPDTSKADFEILDIEPDRTTKTRYYYAKSASQKAYYEIAVRDGSARVLELNRKVPGVNVSKEEYEKMINTQHDDEAKAERDAKAAKKEAEAAKKATEKAKKEAEKAKKEAAKAKEEAEKAKKSAKKSE